MNRIKPISTTSNPYVQQYEALRGDRRPVEAVIADAARKRVEANAADAHRLRNRGKILGTLGGVTAGMAVATAAHAGLMDEMGDEAKLIAGAQKAGVHYESGSPADPGDPITIEAQPAEPVDQEPNTVG